MEYTSYLLPFLAILIGYFCFLLVNPTKRQLEYLLSFSGSYLLSIILFEILPEIFESSTPKIGVWIMCGILFQIILDFFSKGAEHGHIHFETEKKENEKRAKKNNKFPLLLFISLSIHALVEGFPIVSNEHIVWGIVIHKIPIAAILTLFFVKGNYSNYKTLLFLLLFAFMTPLGTWIGNSGFISNEILIKINALAIGVLLHVSTTILFETSKNHSFNLKKLVSIILGSVIAFFM